MVRKARRTASTIAADTRLPHAGEVRDEMLEERARRLLLEAPGRELEANRSREAIVCQGQDDDIVAVDGTPTALWPKADA